MKLSFSTLPRASFVGYRRRDPTSINSEDLGDMSGRRHELDCRETIQERGLIGPPDPAVVGEQNAQAFVDAEDV